ncbi:hypothetical protein PM8797T_09584 [Gimesia maris DSM 8797]|nr:hypothetical protein PM8797T_09584 [Gimesia maris DSM 8797]
METNLALFPFTGNDMRKPTVIVDSGNRVHRLLPNIQREKRF